MQRHFVIIQTKEDYDRERATNTWYALKVIWWFICSFLFSALFYKFLPLKYTSFLFFTFIILFMVADLSKNLKLISYIKAIFAVLYSIWGFAFIFVGIYLNDLFFGLVSGGLFLGIAYYNLNKYTTLLEILKEKLFSSKLQFNKPFKPQYSKPIIKNEKDNSKNIMYIIIFILVILVLILFFKPFNGNFNGNIIPVFNNQDLSKIEQLRCWMSNQELYDLFGTPTKITVWNIDNNNPEIMEPNGFIFNYGNYEIHTQSTYIPSLNIIALIQAYVIDKKTKKEIKNINDCIPDISNQKNKEVVPVVQPSQEVIPVVETPPEVKPLIVEGSNTQVIITNNQPKDVSVSVTYNIYSRWFGADYKETKTFEVVANTQKSFLVYDNIGCSTAPCSVSIIEFKEN